MTQPPFKGRVSLVGAGPGDPGLLTVKALKRLERADLIIYDTLANPRHLAHAKSSAIKICVGKGFRYHRLSQARINRLVIRASKKGWQVVRLKGGDPYLFGRGGEEALFLHRHRIPFEVVPGVTSATACAAYAGIPLTHRSHNSTVTFLTGHRAGDRELDSVPWEKLVSIGGTLVVYMGFYNLTKITERLMRAGMPAATRVSVIEWGTLPYQKSCDGTLRTIGALVKKKKLKAPCIIIIGEVVSLGKQLNWFERLPLFGKKIVVTRTRDKAGLLTERLTELGADVLEFPTIEIKPLSDYSQMDRAVREVLRWDWIIFTSTYGVEAFFKRLLFRHNRDARYLSGVKTAVVGPETELALYKRGVLADLKPARFETSALADEFRRRSISLRGKNVLLFRADKATPELEANFKKLGAQVCRVNAYRTKLPRALPKNFKNELLNGRVSLVTFTSASTVSHFVKILGLDFVKRLARRVKFASIGPVTSRTLKAYGLRPACEAKHFTIDGLVEAIRKEGVG